MVKRDAVKQESVRDKTPDENKERWEKILSKKIK